MRLRWIMIALLGCGGAAEKSTSAPPPPPPPPASDPRAARICDRYDAIFKECPALDAGVPHDECVDTMTAGLADHKVKDIVEAIEHCVVEPTGCDQVDTCLHATFLAGLYDVHAYALGADCKSPAGQPSSSPRVGKPMLDLEMTLADGTKLRPAALRGRPLIVTFTAGFEGTADTELAKLAKVTDGDVIAVVSGPEPKQRALTRPRIVVDVPTADENLGPITKAWGVTAVPESFLVDATGIVQYHLPMMRMWTSPAATTCLRTLAK